MSDDDDDFLPPSRFEVSFLRVLKSSAKPPPPRRPLFLCWQLANACHFPFINPAGPGWAGLACLLAGNRRPNRKIDYRDYRRGAARRGKKRRFVLQARVYSGVRRAWRRANWPQRVVVVVEDVAVVVVASSRLVGRARSVLLANDLSTKSRSRSVKPPSTHAGSFTSSSSSGKTGFG